MSDATQSVSTGNAARPREKRVKRLEVGCRVSGSFGEYIANPNPNIKRRVRKRIFGRIIKLLVKRSIGIPWLLTHNLTTTWNFTALRIFGISYLWSFTQLNSRSLVTPGGNLKMPFSNLIIIVVWGSKVFHGSSLTSPWALGGLGQRQPADCQISLLLSGSLSHLVSLSGWLLFFFLSFFLTLLFFFFWIRYRV